MIDLAVPAGQNRLADEDLVRARKWTVALVRPPGYAHSGALLEAAETLMYALRRLGREAGFGRFDVDAEALVVLGAHLLPAAFELPRNAVIFNLEQLPAWAEIHGADAHFYLDRLMRHRVWDYSQANVAWLAARGHARAAHMPLGYVPELSRIPARVQDVDVLFYGMPNPRRARVLEALRGRGLRVEVLQGVYGEERDAWIGRAKVVLNMHYYESKLFEIARVSYLLANRKAVVCEHSVMGADDADLRAGMAYAPYEQLAETCEALVRDDARRAALERQGFELFSCRDQVRTVAMQLGEVPPLDAVAESPAFPTALHLGSGKDFRADCLNVDISASWQPDLLLDFGVELPWGQPLRTGRFGDIRLHENQFEHIVANDVLEHIPDLVQAMTNALRLLRPGGEFLISVPYDLSLGAWQDPTHVRAFNENSWHYYCDWFWYLDWDEARFDLVQMRESLSEFGQSLAAQGQELAVIMRTPRAVDSLQVRLRKRYLTASEREIYRQRRAPAVDAGGGR
ncbi:MAG: methyltransferase domain-containing protein [Burkholderiaceae bacterium]|uniref:methyltransferase domain-containing protein n=1 Tax=Ottowia sp. TaxID=1898956 RepID=UPI002D1FAC8A|nr:methyltransferase domain-containing protein [Ottowia sp.]MCP5256436.1 methyltransferase domain-containing protein [Burkholderiaceae bacterium]